MAYTNSEARAFISKIAPLIQAEAIKRGYRSCATVIAQAILESAAGTSKLSTGFFNYFGLKCGKSWNGRSVSFKTKEDYGKGLVSITDSFRVFSDMADGVKGYYDFIQYARYQNLKTATDYKTYANLLKQDGYATDPNYIKKLILVVENYGLTDYDKGYLPTLKQGAKGDKVKNLQSLLVNKGYTLTIDGAFGAKTLEAVKAFQAENDLAVDGIVGSRTWNKLMN